MTWLLLLTDPDALQAQGSARGHHHLATLVLEIYACLRVLFGEGVEWFRKPIPDAESRYSSLKPIALMSLP